jgi:glycosyltransferase involved in cell wall biosynthesis
MNAAGHSFDHLVVVHYHWRPGGVRRVVELTLPAIVAATPSLKRVTLLSGGAPHERPEIGQLELPTAFIHEPACDYFSGQEDDPQTISRKVQEALSLAMPERDSSRTLIWFQNPALARNPILSREIADFSRRTGAALILHHHDFWCAGRWARWNELQQCGCADISSAAGVLFASGTRAVHAGINLQDFRILEQFFPQRAFYLANPVDHTPPARQTDIDTARAWAAKEIKSEAPLWIFPSRFLRRKNFLEAALITRWLRPEAILATTSGQFSQDEANYAHDIKDAASRGGWRVHFGLLDKPGAPRVGDVFRIAETVVHTSVQEGFGMGFVEAAAVGTPLIAKSIPSVMDDLSALGFEFPQLYDDLHIAPGLFDAVAESSRQAALADSARKSLPGPFQNLFQPLRFDASSPIPFSRLTRRGQLEVLSHEAAKSWDMCKALNPCLEKWLHAPLSPTPWPDRPVRSPQRYAEEFLKIASSIPRSPIGHSLNASHAQMEFAKRALAPDSIFPIQLEI